MVVIRFQRRGTKKAPHHRIVVTDRRKSQAGRVLEVLGNYDPSTNPPKFSVDESRLDFWLSSGAKASESFGRLLKRFQKGTPSTVHRP